LQSSRRRRDEIDDIFADDVATERRATAPSLRPIGGTRGNGSPPSRGVGDVRDHFVAPKNFNDVQDVADRFKDPIPVMLNPPGTARFQLMRVGLIGAGNMARAMARGWGDPVLCSDVGSGRAQALAKELGGEALASNVEVARRADLVVLCHKPAQLLDVAAEIA